MLPEDYISRRLSDLCKKNGVSAYRLSKQTGITQSVLSEVFRNKRTPTILTLDKLCSALGITLAQFFTEAGFPANLSQQQKELLSLWEDLTAEEKNMIKTLMKGLKEKE